MKDKRLIISWPVFILIILLYFYIYRRNPLDNEFDFGLINIILLILVLVINSLTKHEFIRHIVTIIFVLIFIGIYFLI